jgi:MFS family permease
VAGSYYSLLTVVPLWLKLDPDHGGFQLDSWQSGLLMAAAGPILFITQPFVAPYIIQRFGLRGAWTLESALWGLVLLATPFASQVTHGWAVLCVLWMAHSVLYQMVLAACFVMQNNAVPPEIRGTFVGMATAIAAFARLVLPGISAPIFAWAAQMGTGWPVNHHLTFDALGLVVLAASVLSLALPPTIEMRHEPPLLTPPPPEAGDDDDANSSVDDICRMYVEF